MSLVRFVARLVALLAPSLLVPALASAQVTTFGSTGSTTIGLFANGTPVAQRTISVRFTGQLTVSFHGDAATGCALRGLCAYSGTVSWRPPPVGALELSTFRVHGRFEYSLSLFPGNLINFSGAVGGVTNADVQLSSTPLGSPPAGASSCLDAVDTGGSFDLPLRHGRVAFALAGATFSLLSTHCAGPLIGDVRPEIPAPTLPLSTVRHGHATVALTASRSFASHGFAGSVVSSLTIALGRPGRARRPARTPGARNRQAAPRGLKVLYRATLSGSVVERVTGDSNLDICTALGSCGLAGTLTLTPRADAKASFTAIASPRTPYRDLLAAVGLRRHGRTRGIFAFGGASLTGGVGQADLVQASTSCRDSVALGSGALVLTAVRGRLRANYIAEPARTRCPGPTNANIPSLGTGVIPLARLTRQTITLPLTAGSSFVDYGYHVRTVPNLVLTLTRVRVRILRGGSASSFGSGFFGR